ncbi:hypothetical protein [Hyalangium rubrum]|uniref:Lipoprotein n=1 Tax=Hyalangium rubrum TaxID=3103134 RepID=A0ABU5H9N0_9BACT|nr:hypothetical protein [Hyalangium sp. s54d21]MDY7229794.1 hypothetical protein [Hyalangium sp. s54d21]
MRHLGPALLCLLAACGGNFSNDDLEYLNALPTREELASKLPGSGKSSGQGLARRRDGLALGDPSDIYKSTQEASGTFNAGLDGLLSLLEAIRTTPPTTREPTRRTWGPFADSKRPGHDARFVMERDGDSFDYRLQYKRSKAGDETWWSFLEGSFKADAGIRKGEGELHLFIEEAVAKGLEVGEGLRGLRRLDIGYQTRQQPIRVEMIFAAPSTTSSEIRYTYREQTGGFGEMRFLLKNTDAVPGNAKEDVEITSRWTPSSGGVGMYTILVGDLLGASFQECWDAQGRILYAKGSWQLFGIGRLSDCIQVPDFGP